LGAIAQVSQRDIYRPTRIGQYEIGTNDAKRDVQFIGSIGIAIGCR
jgi:hypothetical protein